MTTEANVYLEKYLSSNPDSYKAVDRAVNILKLLLTKLAESYIIGSSIRNIILEKPITNIDIITTATPEIIKETIPTCIEFKGKLVLKENGVTYTFITFSDETNNKKNPDFYNKKIENATRKELFTIDSLAMSPKLIITDLFHGIDDIKNRTIKLIDAPNKIIKENPSLILRTFKYQAELDFVPNKHLLSIIKLNSKNLKSLNNLQLASFMRLMITLPYGKKVLTYIDKKDLFSYIFEYQILVQKLLKYESLSLQEKLTLSYLTVGSIPDASYFNEVDVMQVSEFMSITRLLIEQSVTPMMVYNIGEKTLLSCDKIASIYKKTYHSQVKKIRKLSSNQVITSSRELNFTRLELVSILNGERSIRITPIMNILLEKVINGDVPNYNKFLKEEVKSIIDEMNKIFNYEEPVFPIRYSDKEILDLKEKYQKEYEFLLRVYLNDEKSLYDLSPQERKATKDQAASYAREFLLSTSQYRILVERGLI